MESQKSVCVIGSGLSGLASIKCLVDAGFNVKCFEKSQHIYGRWHAEGDMSIPRSTITNLPKFLSCFQDFPMPDNFPLYLSAEQFCEYFQIYAKHFDLLKHIHVGCEVLSLRPIECSSDVNVEEGKSERLLSKQYRWVVTYHNTSNISFVEEFDFVVVSSGFYTSPYIPQSMGTILQNFTGKVIHCIDYKNWHPFENQTVIVCGLGNTGGDVASDVSDHSVQTYISTSKGAYVIPRICQGGLLPVERGATRIQQYMPSALMGKLAEISVKRIANSIYNIDELRLTPKNSSSRIVNDEICLKIASGKVKVKPSIERIVGDTVYFTNGSVIENVDTIILCTGYKRSFPFLSEDVVRVSQNEKYMSLYKYMFTSKYRESLAFVGMFSVFGPLVPVVEMQARYIVEVFRKAIVLPSTDKMSENIEKEKNALDAKFGAEMKEYNTISSPWLYMDDLAYEIGCKPSLSSMLFNDPRLAWHLMKSYSVHEYRLKGPNRWDGARETILSKNQKMFSFMNESRDVES